MVLGLMSKISLVEDIAELNGLEYLLNYIGSTFHGTAEYKFQLKRKPQTS